MNKSHIIILIFRTYINTKKETKYKRRNLDRKFKELYADKIDSLKRKYR